MNKLLKYRQLIVAAIGIAALVISLGISGRALAAQNVADLSAATGDDNSHEPTGR